MKLSGRCVHCQVAACACHACSGNTRAMEHLLRCPRYALRTAGRSAAPLLPTLAQARLGCSCIHALFGCLGILTWNRY